MSIPASLFGVTDHQVLIDAVVATVGAKFSPHWTASDKYSVKENSGFSGAKLYFVTRLGTDPDPASDTADTVIANSKILPSNTVVLKISRESDSVAPISKDRYTAVTTVLAEHDFIPPTLFKGEDFQIDPYLGGTVALDGRRMQLDTKKAPVEAVARLLARLHSLPTGWLDESGLRERIVARDARLSEVLRAQPGYSHCWQTSSLCLESGRAGFRGEGEEFREKIFEMLLEPLEDFLPEFSEESDKKAPQSVSVYAKFLSCEAFHPHSTFGRRVVIFHDDFKPDNILLDEETREQKLHLIDFDGCGVGAAVVDLAFMFFTTSYLQRREGSPGETLENRLNFAKLYMEALSSNGSFGVSEAEPTDEEARALVLDVEIFTLVGRVGLLNCWHEDVEITLLRGREHPTRVGFCKEEQRGFFDAETPPTGGELIDLLAAAIREVRAESGTWGELREAVIRDGIVQTMMRGGLMCGERGEVLRKYLLYAKEADLLSMYGVPPAGDS